MQGNMASSNAAGGDPLRPCYLDEEDWAAIRAHMQEYDEKRENVIKRTRGVA